MLRYVTLGIAGVFFWGGVVAQLPEGRPFIPDSAFFELATVRYVHSAPSGRFPCTVDLRAELPPVAKQVNHTDCAATTVGFTVASYLKHKIYGSAYTRPDGSWDKTNLFSSFFLHNPSAVVPAELEAALGVCQQPPGLTPVVRAYNDNGCCTTHTFLPDTTSPRFCKTMPGASAYTEAAIFKPLDCVFLAGYGSGGVVTPVNDDVLQEIRNLLIQNIPVIISIQVDDFGVFSTYRNKPAGYVWSPVTGNRDNHIMLVVGYDHKKCHFIIRNSQGVSWGDQGHMRISYNDFKSRVLGVFYYPLSYRRSVMMADSSAMAFSGSYDFSEPQEAKSIKSISLPANTYALAHGIRISYLGTTNGQGLFAISDSINSKPLASIYAHIGQTVSFVANGRVYQLKYKGEQNQTARFYFYQSSVSKEVYIRQLVASVTDKANGITPPKRSKKKK